jgi:hypothetical protein
MRLAANVNEGACGERRRSPARGHGPDAVLMLVVHPAELPPVAR